MFSKTLDVFKLHTCVVKKNTMVLIQIQSGRLKKKHRHWNAIMLEVLNELIKIDANTYKE